MKRVFFLFCLPLLISQISCAFERMGPVQNPWFHDNSQPIEYFINLGEFQNAANKQQIIQAINDAFHLIQDNPQIEIEFSYLGETDILPAEDDLNIVYIDSDNSFVLVAGVTINYMVENNGLINSADIALTSDFASDNLNNLFALTLHELLHFLGLSHSTTGPDSAVYENTANSDISADDLAGLATIYPSASHPLSETTGAVSGRVISNNQNPVFARLVAYDTNINNPQPRIVTNRKFDAGLFDLIGIPPGSYRIVAESATTNFIHEYLNNGQIFNINEGDNIFNMNLQLQRPPNTTNLFNSHLLGKSLYHEPGNLIYSASYPRVYAISRAGFVDTLIPGRADDIAFSNDQSELFAIDQIERTLKVIDLNPDSPDYQTIVETITNLPAQPTSLVVNSDNLAFISTSVGKSIVVFDMSNRTLIGTVNTDKFNKNISLSYDERTLYLGAFFNPNWSILEINTDMNSPNFLSIKNEHNINRTAAYIARPDLYNRFLFVGTLTGVDIFSLPDYERVHQVQTDVYISSLEPSQDGGYMYFLGYDNSELRNKQLWKFDINNMEVVEQSFAGADFQYLSPTRVNNKLMVSGQAGLSIINTDVITPIFKNSFEEL